jgi:hypothetical protein
MVPQPDRSELVRDCLAALDVVEAAESALREQLHRLDASVGALRAHLESGGTSQGMRDVIDITTQRAASDDALRGLEAARVLAQHAIYRLASADGMNAADIGRAWGVSRQLVSRVLNHVEHGS